MSIANGALRHRAQGSQFCETDAFFSVNMHSNDNCDDGDDGGSSSLRVTPWRNPRAWLRRRYRALHERTRFRALCGISIVLFVALCALFVLFVRFGIALSEPRAVGIALSQTMTASRERSRHVQPVGKMSDATHALILMRDPLFRNYTLLGEDDVTGAELRWRASAAPEHSTFLLEPLWQLVEAELLAQAQEAAQCVCWAAYGVPYNIVSLHDRDGDVVHMFEPRITAESSRSKIRVRIQCSLHALMEEARAIDDPSYVAQGAQHKMLTNESGTLGYISCDGSRQRRVLEGADFACVKHCVEFFPLRTPTADVQTE